MVIQVAVAAKAASAASQVGATALGLGMGKSDLELSRDIFRQQMQQTKRLWTADFAESSVRHGEACAQAARQHAEAQATAAVAYFQAERLAGQGVKLARDQDARSYEMAWRAEVWESLRDELGNQNNRFNILMLCDTVCLGCVFSLAADGSPPEETGGMMLNAYILCLGVSIMLFTVSLWASVIVVRRLHDNTAARLERKLFAQSEDLQRAWREQLARDQPTGPQEMYLVNQAYAKWVAANVDPLGMAAVNMLSVGVVMMFVTAGLLIHNRYQIEYANASIAVPIIFWSIVVVTSTTVLSMKFSEDRSEKRKQGVYDASWQDDSVESTILGPFAKVAKAGDDLSSGAATDLGSVHRIEALLQNERTERAFCVPNEALRNRVDALSSEATDRAATRKEVLKLLMTASEEYDTLPEELISRLNKMLHSIDEADERNSHLIATDVARSPPHVAPGLPDRTRAAAAPPPPRDMAPHPVDAKDTPLGLGALRAKLGEIKFTTLLRLRNESNEPLRLKSGVQLKEGKYVNTITSISPSDASAVCYLYPAAEVPPRTELCIACRSAGGWLPTSGIDGEIVYTNRDESWNFNIKFCNSLIRHERTCKVEANTTACSDAGTNDSVWQVSKEELDHKANNEIVIVFRCLHGEEAAEAALCRIRSGVTFKSGYLLKKGKPPFRAQWEKRWFSLNFEALLYSKDNTGQEPKRIVLANVKHVRPDASDAAAFEIGTHSGILHRLYAGSSGECREWVHILLKAANIIDSTAVDSCPTENVPADGSMDENVELYMLNGAILPL